MTALEAWLIIGAMFAVPGLLLWRWRHEPSKPQARQDYQDALDHLRDAPEREAQITIDQWRARGRSGF